MNNCESVTQWTYSTNSQIIRNLASQIKKAYLMYQNLTGYAFWKENITSEDDTVQLNNNNKLCMNRELNICLNKYAN